MLRRQLLARPARLLAGPARHVVLGTRSMCSASATAQQQSTLTITPPDAAPSGDDEAEAELERALRPKEIVDQLDRYIVGQPDAKRAVAVAMRNRWRRQRVASPLKEEISPKVGRASRPCSRRPLPGPPPRAFHPDRRIFS